eukprot:gene24335-biopygen4403
MAPHLVTSCAHGIRTAPHLVTSPEMYNSKKYAPQIVTRCDTFPAPAKNAPHVVTSGVAFFFADHKMPQDGTSCGTSRVAMATQQRICHNICNKMWWPHKMLKVAEPLFVRFVRTKRGSTNTRCYNMLQDVTTQYDTRTQDVTRCDQMCAFLHCAQVVASCHKLCPGLVLRTGAGAATLTCQKSPHRTQYSEEIISRIGKVAFRSVQRRQTNAVWLRISFRACFAVCDGYFFVIP